MARAPAPLLALALVAAVLAGCAAPEAQPAPSTENAAFGADVNRALSPVFEANNQVAAAGNLSERAPMYNESRATVLKAHATLAAMQPPPDWATAHKALVLWLEALQGEYAAGPPCAAGDQEKCGEYAEYVRLAGETLRVAQAAMPPA